MILFLDLGLSTGWAHDGAEDGKPVTGLITLPAGVDGRHGHTFDVFRAALGKLICRTAPSWLGYEAPIASLMHGGTHFDACMILVTLAGLTEMVAHELGIPYRRLNVGTIRKEFCGHGHAKKPMVGRRCKELGWETGNDNNRADAAAGWWALNRIAARGEL